MLRVFISKSEKYMSQSHANLFKAVCEFWGITNFYYFKHIENVMLTHIPGVYIFINNFTIPVYVGKSKDLKKRVIKSHSAYDEESIIIIDTLLDYDKAGILETALIGGFQPVKNKKRRIV